MLNGDKYRYFDMYLKKVSKNYLIIMLRKYKNLPTIVRCLSSDPKTKQEIQEIKTPPAPPLPPITPKKTGLKPATAESLVKSDPLLPSFKKTIDTSSVEFDEVPGPKVLQHFAKFWSFIPAISNEVTTSTIQYMLGANKLIGSQLNWGRNGFLFRWLLNEYGPIVRLQGPFGGDVVILSRPEDALAVFTSEGRYPIRSSLDCIEKYRLQYRRYKHAGPFAMYGEDWEKLRSQVVESLNNSTTYQFNKIEKASSSFVDRIKKIKNKQDEVPPNFADEISKWALDSLCSVILGQRHDFFQPPVLTPEAVETTSDTLRLLRAYYGATDAIRRCESGVHFWKFLETRAWKALVKNCDIIDSILGKHLEEAEASIKVQKESHSFSKDNVPLLELMLLQDGMYPEDILTVMLDMILIGVNAVTHSMAFLMYHLARNPRAQRILADEIRSTPEILTTPSEIIKMKYLQACIKESLRLKPPIPFLNRILTKDIIVHNYRIPKGTVILMATYLSSIKEEHFDDALKFIPERWLNQEYSSDTSFACIPFGYGPKACLAKNLAEMQLSILITQIMRNFKLEYHYGDINSTNKLLACADRPLRFRFVNRLI